MYWYIDAWVYMCGFVKQCFFTSDVLVIKSVSWWSQIGIRKYKLIEMPDKKHILLKQKFVKIAVVNVSFYLHAFGKTSSLEGWVQPIRKSFDI